MLRNGCHTTSAHCELLIYTYVNYVSFICLLTACESEYSNGIVWPKRQSGSSVSIRCSVLHSSFRSGVYITRMCFPNGQWGDVDMSACTMRSEATPLVMVETSSEVNASLLTSQVQYIVFTYNIQIQKS